MQQYYNNISNVFLIKGSYLKSVTRMNSLLFSVFKKRFPEIRVIPWQNRNIQQNNLQRFNQCQCERGLTIVQEVGDGKIEEVVQEETGIEFV